MALRCLHLSDVIKMREAGPPMRQNETEINSAAGVLELLCTTSTVP